MAIEHVLLLTRAHLPVLPPSSDLVYTGARLVEEPEASWTAEDYGIRASYRVYFRLNKFKLDEAEQSLLSLVGDILGQSDDDALLLGHCELPVLRRTGGRLVLSSRSPWLAPEQTDLLGLPYEVEDLGEVP